MSFSNLKHLLGGTIRFTQPKAFNDPFELIPEVYLNYEVNGFLLDVSSPKREAEPARLSDDFKSENCNDIVAREVLSKLNEMIGILCLSRNPNSLLMWSHYADEYKGVVVEFDETHEFFTGLFPVSYENNRPKIDFHLLQDSAGHIRLSELCYKPEEWEYENEVRVACNLDSCKPSGCFNGFDVYVMDIPLECIKKITMGERMPIEHQKYILDKINNTNIELWLAAISNWGYNFRFEQVKCGCPLSEMPPIISPRTAHIFKDLKGNFGDIARWMVDKHPMASMLNKTL